MNPYLFFEDGRTVAGPDYERVYGDPEPPPEIPRRRSRRPRRRQEQVLWGVSAKFGEFTSGRKDRYHVELFVEFDDAAKYAKRMTQNGWKGVLVKRVTGERAIEEAQLEIDRVRDWESDIETYY